MPEPAPRNAPPMRDVLLRAAPPASPGAARTGPARRMGFAEAKPADRGSAKRKGTRQDGCLPQQPGYQGGARTAGLSAFLASRTCQITPVTPLGSRVLVRPSTPASRTPCGASRRRRCPPGAGRAAAWKPPAAGTEQISPRAYAQRQRSSCAPTDGLNNCEIAEAVGVTRQTVRTVARIGSAKHRRG